MTTETYSTVIAAIEEVVNGRRGWYSLTEGARVAGVSREKLIEEAKSRGLIINRGGRYGYCCSRPAATERREAESGVNLSVFELMPNEPPRFVTGFRGTVSAQATPDYTIEVVVTAPDGTKRCLTARLSMTEAE